MPKIAYITKRFNRISRGLIQKANEIIEDYEAQGFTLTLRQLYYQFVSKGLIENSLKSYDRLGSVINDARMAGLIDWNAIEDRTRFVRSLAHWDSPAHIVQSCASQYRVDMWEGQTYRPEVWIEKDALVGVFEGICQEFDVPLFSCRGYTSQSEMWVAAQRVLRVRDDGQLPVILHFGDHDPSGMDMSRDITDRITLFSGGIEMKRLALNMDQIKQYNPPPNPAKSTDSRYQGYILEFGHESWELDALNPTTLAELVSSNINELIDIDPWNDAVERRDTGRTHLKAISDNWKKIEKRIQENTI